MNWILQIFALTAVAGALVGTASLAVAFRENQIRRAWKQSREGCIHWLENPDSDLPETFRD